METDIYALTDDHYYYIGKTKQGVELRFRQHIQVSKEFHPTRKINKWLYYHLENGSLDQVTYHTLETVNGDDWKKAERDWIYSYQLHFGEDRILNMADGGSGGQTGRPSSFTQEEIEYIRNLEKPNIMELADLFDTSYGAISKILRNTRSYDPDYEPNTGRVGVNITSKMSDEKAEQVRNYHIEYPNLTHHEIGQLFGITGSNVTYILRNKTWKDPYWDGVNYQWLDYPQW